jgi:hypothetical protein
VVLLCGGEGGELYGGGGGELCGGGGGELCGGGGELCGGGRRRVALRWRAAHSAEASSTAAGGMAFLCSRPRRRSTRGAEEE